MNYPESTNQPSASEIATWLEQYPKDIALKIESFGAWRDKPSFQELAALVAKKSKQIATDWLSAPEKLLHLLDSAIEQEEQSTQPESKEFNRNQEVLADGSLLTLGKLVNDLIQLEPSDFQEKWQHEPGYKKGYFTFQLPKGLISKVQEAAQQLPDEQKAGIDTSLPLSTELRVYVDAKAAHPIFMNSLGEGKPVTKGMLHLIVNVLYGTVFNSAGKTHSRLRTDLLEHSKRSHTKDALVKKLPALMRWFHEVAGSVADTNKKIDIVPIFHSMVLDVFAQQYFSELLLTEEQASQVMKQPTNVFLMGAGARLSSSPLHEILEWKYGQGANELNEVFSKALFAYAKELKENGFGEQLTFIDKLLLYAYEQGNYQLLYTNLMSALAAGTDTTTEVYLTAFEAIYGSKPESKARKEKIIAEFSQNHPEIAQKLKQGNAHELTLDEWEVLATPSRFSPELEKLVQESAKKAAPVALTFKAFEDNGHEVTCLMPMKSMAHSAEEHGIKISPFGAAGSESQCTGMDEALTKVGAFILQLCFTEYEFILPQNPPKRATLIVSNRVSYSVKVQSS